MNMKTHPFRMVQSSSALNSGSLQRGNVGVRPSVNLFSSSPQAFTLLELLVVIGMLALLSPMLVAGLARANHSSRSVLSY